MSIRLFLFFAIFPCTMLHAQVKIGIINKQQLLDSLPSRKAMLEEIAQIEAIGVKELIAMDSTLQVMYAEYQKSGSNCTLTLEKSTGPSAESRLRDFQQRIIQREKDVDRVLDMLNQECDSKSKLIIQEAVKTVTEKLGLDLVIDSSQTFYFKEKLDITDAVLLEMVKIDKSANLPLSKSE